MKTRDKYKLYKPKKFLGQNFLVDENISKKIVNQLDIKETDIVLEIGPGQGALTKYIAETCKKYIAVEIDKNMAEALEGKYGNIGKIVNEDFLKYDIGKFKKRVKIIGNLPYNIASEILFKLFDNREVIEFAVLMVQKEFARRLVANPNSKEYGIMSVQTQVFSKPEILFNVPPTVFFPKPKVDSSVIKLGFSNHNLEIINKDIFKNLVRNSFGKRRKYVRNSLKDYFRELNLSFDDVGLFFDFTRRAENIKIEEYVMLANKIFSIGLKNAE